MDTRSEMARIRVVVAGRAAQDATTTRFRPDSFAW